MCETKELSPQEEVLIPKKMKTAGVGDYKPISVLDISIKITSKVLANRLRGILPGLIGDHQAGFVKGRRILDCIPTI